MWHAVSHADNMQGTFGYSSELDFLQYQLSANMKEPSEMKNL
jgi:hypothetical protein